MSSLGANWAQFNISCAELRGVQAVTWEAQEPKEGAWRLPGILPVRITPGPLRGGSREVHREGAWELREGFSELPWDLRTHLHLLHEDRHVHLWSAYTVVCIVIRRDSDPVAKGRRPQETLNPPMKFLLRPWMLARVGTLVWGWEICRSFRLWERLFSETLVQRFFSQCAMQGPHMCHHIFLLGGEGDIY